MGWKQTYLFECFYIFKSHLYNQENGHIKLKLKTIEYVLYPKAVIETHKIKVQV